MSSRTPTPAIDQIWHPETTTNRWHQLWIRHLIAQTQRNHSHPGRDDIQKYDEAARHYLARPWTDQIAQREQTTRHDVQAALDVFNQHAGATTAHMGLTSHDITEHATQDAIRESVQHLHKQTSEIVTELSAQAQRWRHTPLLARTHGQPAQTTSYGYRIATILGPLLDWRDRVNDVLGTYWQRPAWGAVGNAADLVRVICQPDLPDPDSYAELSEYGYEIAPDSMHSTRQIYHRSYDLPVASAMVELASIAQTWATDRRLEAMLGLGNETRSEGQVGSSAMAHKTNPVLCERICSLAQLTLGHYTTMASLASQGWLEGDVSTSGARREVLPAMFSNVEAILTNWLEALRRFEPDEKAMAVELYGFSWEIATGALLQWMVGHGVARDEAHRVLRDCAGDLMLERIQQVAGATGRSSFEVAAVVNQALKVPPSADWLVGHLLIKH